MGRIYVIYTTNATGPEFQENINSFAVTDILIRRCYVVDKAAASAPDIYGSI